MTPLEALRNIIIYSSPSVNLHEETKILGKVIKAFEIIKELFDFDFALRFPNDQPMLMITNKKTNDYWEIPITKEKYDLLKEVLL